MDYLRQIDPGNPHPIIICLNQEEMLIGRHTVASLTPYSQVSRYHACLTRRNGSWCIKDLGSLNDLYVNFTKVGRGSQELELGDIIGFGTATLSGNGGFACVLKSRVKQEDQNLPATPPNRVRNRNSREAGEASSSHQSMIAADVLKSKGVKREIFEDISVNQCENNFVPWNRGNSYGKDTVLPLTPPKQSLHVPVAVKRERSESPRYGTSCSTVSENARSSEESDESLEILYDSNAAVRPSSSYQSTNSCSLKNSLKPKREYSSTDSVCTEPASPNLLLSSGRNRLKIEDAFHYEERDANNKGLGVSHQGQSEGVTNSCIKPNLCDPVSQGSVRRFISDSLRYSTNNDVPSHDSSLFPLCDESKEDIRRGFELSSNHRTDLESDEEYSSSDSKVCRVDLIRCDSKNFKWPRDVKPFNIPERLSEPLRHTRVNGSANTPDYMSQDDTSSSSEAFIEGGILAKRTTHIRLSRKLKIKVKNNKILSSDSDGPDDELESSCESPSEVMTESDLLEDVGSLSTESESSCVNTLQVSRRRRMQSKPKPKRLKLYVSDKSDSSVSSHSEILYPSARVIEQLSATATSMTPIRKQTKDSSIVLGSQRKTAGRTLLTEFKPVQCRPGRLRGRKEWFQNKCASSGLQDSNCSPVRNPQMSDLVPKSIPRINVGLTGKSLVGNTTDSFRRRGKAVTRSPLQEPGSSECCNDVGREKAGLEQTPRLKARKNVTVPKRPLRFGSRMGFLVSMQENTGKGSETKKLDPCSRATSESKHKPQGQVPGIQIVNSFTTRTDSSDAKETDTNCVEVESSRKSPNGGGEVAEWVSTVESSRKSPNGGEVAESVSTVESSRKSPNGDSEVAESVSTVESCNGNSEMAPKRKEALGKSEKLSPDSENRKVAVVLPISHYSSEENHRTQAKSPCLFDSYLLIEKIVYWNPKWLEEQKVNDLPPPATCQGASSLPLSFESYESYVSSLHPMIVMDVWQSLFQKYQEILLPGNGSLNTFYYSVSSCKENLGVLQVHCQAVVNETLSYRPSEGNVVLLNTMDTDPNVDSCIFGYIYQHSVEEFRFSNPTKWSRAMPSEWLRDAKFWKFCVYVKKRRKVLERGSVGIAHGILNIRDKLQSADALRSFQSSPLQKSIVQPSPEAFFVPDPDLSKSNTRQILNEIVEEMNPKSPVKLFLLHGPPGTGKTEMVVNLIERLSAGASCKILVCATSDPALDEIGHRLVRKKGDSISFVRIGSWPGIHSKLSQYCLDRLEKQRRKTQINEVEDAINNVLFTDSDGGMNYRKRVDNNALRVLMDKYRSLKEQNASSGCSTQRNPIEWEIMKESGVILSTLESVAQPTLFEGMPFTCCIVDGATQCTEPEILQCLTSGVSKLVLMGDCHQLQPPVKSEHALKCGFGRSLFERVCLFFKHRYGIVPFFTLKEQYRMTPEICHFPSSYFYNGALVTAQGRYICSQLRPFTVFDVMADGSLDAFDHKESLVIAYMCSQLLDLDPNLSIGVISTTDQELKECVATLAQDPNLRKVEVNVLEEYQGREKDVVIIPCVRKFFSTQSDESFACERRLNVAITRARECLIVLGHLSYLMPYKHWRALINDAKGRNSYIGVASLRDIPLIFAKTIVYE